MYPLSLNLAIIFGSKLIITNIVEIVKPHVLQNLKRKKETKGTPVNITDIIIDIIMTLLLYIVINRVIDYRTRFDSYAVKLVSQSDRLTALIMNCTLNTISYQLIHRSSYH